MIDNADNLTPPPAPAPVADAPTWLRCEIVSDLEDVRNYEVEASRRVGCEAAMNASAGGVSIPANDAPYSADRPHYVPIKKSVSRIDDRRFTVVVAYGLQRSRYLSPEEDRELCGWLGIGAGEGGSR